MLLEDRPEPPQEDKPAPSVHFGEIAPPEPTDAPTPECRPDLDASPTPPPTGLDLDRDLPALHANLDAITAAISPRAATARLKCPDPLPVAEDSESLARKLSKNSHKNNLIF